MKKYLIMRKTKNGNQLELQALNKKHINWKLFQPKTNLLRNYLKIRAHLSNVWKKCFWYCYLIAFNRLLDYFRWFRVVSICLSKSFFFGNSLIRNFFGLLYRVWPDLHLRWFHASLRYCKLCITDWEHGS